MQNTPEIARRVIGLVLDVQAHCVVPLLIGLAHYRSGIFHFR